MDSLERRINSIITDALATRDVMFGHLADRLNDAGAQEYVEAQFAGLYHYDRVSDDPLAYYRTALAAVVAMICAADDNHCTDMLMALPESPVTIDCTIDGLYTAYHGYYAYGIWTMLDEALIVDEWFDDRGGGRSEPCLANEDDGQPSEYEEWQDLPWGGDDRDSPNDDDFPEY